MSVSTSLIAAAAPSTHDHRCNLLSSSLSISIYRSMLVLSNAQVAVILQASADSATHDRDEELNAVYQKTQQYVNRFNSMNNAEKERQEIVDELDNLQEYVLFVVFCILCIFLHGRRLFGLVGFCWHLMADDSNDEREREREIVIDI
jgi:hypothetical protein